MTDASIRHLYLERLSMMLDAGTELVAALAGAARPQGGPFEKFASTARLVEEGERLSDAMSASGLWPSFVPALVKAGEETGELPRTLLDLAGYYEEDAWSRRLLGIESAYLATAYVAYLAALSVLTFFFLPALGQMGTWALRFHPTAMKAPGILLVASVVLPPLLFFLGKKARARVLLPFFGTRSDLARVLYVLSASLRARIATNQALQLAGEAARDPFVRKKLAVSAAMTSEGARIMDALKKSGLLKDRFHGELRILEALGSEEEVAARLFQVVEKDEESAAKKGRLLLRPAYVLIASAMVVVVLGLYLFYVLSVVFGPVNVIS